MLAPEFDGGVVVGYLVRGRLALPKNAPVFQIGDTASAANQLADTAGEERSPSRATPATPPTVAPDPGTTAADPTLQHKL